MEKTFIDFYLLEQHDYIMKTYNNFLNIERINAFEQCLLIDVLVRNNQIKDAQRLASFILRKSSGEEGHKATLSSQDYADKFDMIVNLNMKKEQVNASAADSASVKDSEEERKSGGVLRAHAALRKPHPVNDSDSSDG